MLDYSIKTRTVTGGSESLKGFATLNLGGVFQVRDIAVCYSSKKDTYFISMPAYLTGKTDENGNVARKSFCFPADKEFYRELSEHIINCFLNSEKQYAEIRETDHMAPPLFSPEIRLYEKEDSPIKGFCSLRFGGRFIVDNIRIQEREDGRLQICMPSRKVTGPDGKEGYINVCYPVTKEFSTQLYESIRDTYQAAVYAKEQEALLEPVAQNKSASRKNGTGR